MPTRCIEAATCSCIRIRWPGHIPAGKPGKPDRTSGRPPAVLRRSQPPISSRQECASKPPSTAPLKKGAAGVRRPKSWEETRREAKRLLSSSHSQIDRRLFRRLHSKRKWLRDRFFGTEAVKSVHGVERSCVRRFTLAGNGATIARAARAITGRLLSQLPARDRFHCVNFGEAVKIALFGPASDRSGMRPASTDEENNR
jgi:hypothetical protein